MSTSQPPRGKRQAVIGAWLQAAGIIWPVAMFIQDHYLRDYVIGPRRWLDGQLGVSVMLLCAAAVIFGLLATLVGLVVSMRAMLVSRFRSPWFFWFHLIYALILLTGFPVGTIIGLVILCYILPHKAEFFPSPPSAPTGE